MKVVIINKSDSTGGAAVVSRRLMLALRDAGVDASMIVVEKRHDSPFVQIASSAARIKQAFLAERLKIFIANGLDRANLFKVDIASDGLPLHRHRLVREADVICLNWVNQGMLSMQGLRKIIDLGKPVVWTMHDMWNMTGICHHAGDCTRWLTNCGLCPFLGTGAKTDDLSFSVWNNKKSVYRRGHRNLHFVAVSNWLADLARRSPLFSHNTLSVIPNAFPIPEEMPSISGLPSISDDNLQIPLRGSDGKFRIFMGAARLDDPVKGLPILIEATKVLRRCFPEEAERVELVTFGNLKDPGALDDVAVAHRHLGVISGEESLRRVYASGDAVISTSLYETLPGTLVEGLVYGCIPVSFDRGGQADIVDHLRTGYIAHRDDNIAVAASNIAGGIIWAMKQPEEIRTRMFRSAAERFSATVVAQRYIDLFRSLLKSR